MTTWIGDASSQSPLEESAGRPSDREIAERAYARYQERGGADGADLEDWLEAERELLLRARAEKQSGALDGEESSPAARPGGTGRRVSASRTAAREGAGRTAASSQTPIVSRALPAPSSPGEP